MITANAGAIPEVVGKAGLMINPRKTKELATAIDLVLKSPELRQGMVERGYRRLNNFSWQKAAKQTLKALTT